MKSLLIVSAKGGTGRTTLTSQLARYLQLVSHRRVLVLDLAEPACCAHLLGRCPHAPIVGGRYTADLRSSAGSLADGSVHVLSADAVGGLVSRDDPARARYYANLRHLLSFAAPWFDVCLIDCPALPDLRAVCAEALVDAVVSPVVLSPTCVDCIAELINGTYGIRNVRARLNPQLRFVGLLPLMGARIPLERAWARVPETTLREWLIPDQDSSRGYLYLPLLDATGQAQGKGMPVGQPVRGDVQAREGYRATRACLDALTRQLGAGWADAALVTPDAEVCDA